MAKVAAVNKKGKKKSTKKTVPKEQESKFISQALVNRRKKLRKKKKRPRTKGLVYVKNLPHGFFEEQLRSYFAQFGAVTRLRLGRSPKTLNSRGYAFVEFRYPEVAEIAAQAMNNYIMFHRIVKAKYIPPSQIKHDYFRCSIMRVIQNGEKVLTSKTVLARQANTENINRLMTDKDQKARVSKVRSKVNKQKERLAKLGIDFDVDSVAKNMSEEVIKPVQRKSTAITIDNLKEDDLDDEADETFDPSTFDIDSSDEFQDYDYESDDLASDELDDEDAKTKAVEFAKNASKNKENGSEKTEKRKKGKRNTVEINDEPKKKKTAGKSAPQAEKTEPQAENLQKRGRKKVIDKVPSQIEKPVKSKVKAVKEKEETKKVEKVVAAKKNKKVEKKSSSDDQKKTVAGKKAPSLKVDSPKLKKAGKKTKKGGK